MKKWLVKIGKIVLTILVVIALFWVAYLFRFNLGDLLNKIWKKKETGTQPKVIDQDGNVVGEAVEIVQSKNPFRDKKFLILANGDKVKLPNGVVDSDVDSVILESPGVYDIRIKHNRLTGVFG